MAHATSLALPRRADILGVGISVTDYAEVVRCVMDAAAQRRRLMLAASDVNALMQAQADPAFAAVLNAFDIVTPDGQPVRWGLHLTRQAQLADRVYGPTLTLQVCEAAARAGEAVYLYGSRPETLSLLQRKLTQRFPALRVAGTLPGRFRALTDDEQRDDAAAIMASGASIVLVGMGCPRQEWWIFSMRDRITLPMLGVGAAFDFHAGLVPQAPPWMQARGLEWMFRLRSEPRRLWRRYLLVTPRYLPLLASQALGLRRFEHVTDLTDAVRRNCPG